MQWKEDLLWCPSQLYCDITEHYTLYLRWRHRDPWAFYVIKDLNSDEEKWHKVDEFPFFIDSAYKEAERWVEQWWEEHKNEIDSLVI